MFFSIITSVLTASEELRVNFPSGKYLGALDKSTADSPESMRKGGQVQAKTEDPDAGVNFEDIESGVDRVGEKIDEKKSSILNKPENVTGESEKEELQNED